MVTPYGLVAFTMLGVLSTNNDEWRTAARPFDARRDGFMIGEGAALFILETDEHCRRRGGQAYAEVLGYAATSDAFRLTDEPPEAWGSIAAMRGALADAGIAPERIDYINAHGTGTRMNDKTETHAIKAVLGEHAARVPVSSTKSMVGHLVAAAGAIEFAACLLAIRHQTAPRRSTTRLPDRDCDLDYVPNVSRAMKIDTVLSNSFDSADRTPAWCWGACHEPVLGSAGRWPPMVPGSVSISGRGPRARGCSKQGRNEMSPAIAADAVREIVIRHVSEALLVPIQSVTPSARLLSDLNAESIDIVDIRFRIEDECRIKINQQEMTESLGTGLTEAEFDARFTVGFVIEYVTRQVVAERSPA